MNEISCKCNCSKTLKFAFKWMGRAILILVISIWLYNALSVFSLGSTILGWLLIGITFVYLISLIISVELATMGGLMMIIEGLVPIILMFGRNAFSTGLSLWFGLPLIFAGILILLSREEIIRIEKDDLKSPSTPTKENVEVIGSTSLPILTVPKQAAKKAISSKHRKKRPARKTKRKR